MCSTNHRRWPRVPVSSCSARSVGAAPQEFSRGFYAEHFRCAPAAAMQHLYGRFAASPTAGSPAEHARPSSLRSEAAPAVCAGSGGGLPGGCAATPGRGPTRAMCVDTLRRMIRALPLISPPPPWRRVTLEFDL